MLCILFLTPGTKMDSNLIYSRYLQTHTYAHTLHIVCVCVRGRESIYILLDRNKRLWHISIYDVLFDVVLHIVQNSHSWFLADVWSNPSEEFKDFFSQCNTCYEEALYRSNTLTNNRMLTLRSKNYLIVDLILCFRIKIKHPFILPALSRYILFL